MSHWYRDLRNIIEDVTVDDQTGLVTGVGYGTEQSEPTDTADSPVPVNLDQMAPEEEKEADIKVTQLPTGKWGFIGKVPWSMAFDFEDIGDCRASKEMGFGRAQALAKKAGRKFERIEHMDKATAQRALDDHLSSKKALDEAVSQGSIGSTGSSGSGSAPPIAPANSVQQQPTQPPQQTSASQPSSATPPPAQGTQVPPQNGQAAPQGAQTPPAQGKFNISVGDGQPVDLKSTNLAAAKIEAQKMMASNPAFRGQSMNLNHDMGGKLNAVSKSTVGGQDWEDNH